MDDGYDLTMFGLLRKRAYLAGEIEVHRDKLAALMADLDHIDATIRIFDPDADIADEREAPAADLCGVPGRAIPLPARSAQGRTEAAQHVRSGAWRYEGARDERQGQGRAGHHGRKVGHALRKMSQKGYVGSERTKPGAQMQWWTTPTGTVTDRPGGGGTDQETTIPSARTALTSTLP
jgi:hypothetical protein